MNIMFDLKINWELITSYNNATNGLLLKHLWGFSLERVNFWFHILHSKTIDVFNLRKYKNVDIIGLNFDI